ncbi:class I SAM-dependent methyltransferase [Candidatus Nomurabacteria bacterium]|nr:class I SAM-dependent methyltransferase [Candidatus Nomurabacteria bacterium]
MYILEPILRKLRISRITKNLPKKVELLVDFGCGEEAGVLQDLANYYQRAIGFDGRVSNRKISEKIILQQANLNQRVNLEDNSVDVVICLAVLEHVLKPQELLNEAYRVLKPGGILLLTTPSWVAKPILEFLSYRLKIVDRREIEDHQRYFWNKELKEMLKIAHFDLSKAKVSYFQFACNNFVFAKK